MKYAMGSGSGNQNHSGGSGGLVGMAGSLLGGGKQSHSGGSGGSGGLAGLAGSLLGGGKQSSSGGSGAGAGGLAGMASSFLGGGKQSSQNQNQNQGQGQYGSSQQQSGNYSSDQTGNYSGAHQQQGSSGGGGLMGMVSGYLPGHVSFYPSIAGTSADSSRSMDSKDRAGMDTLVAINRAVTKDRHRPLRTTLVAHRRRHPRTAPRDKTRNTEVITSTTAASTNSLPTAGPHKTQTTASSSSSSSSRHHHHSSPTARTSTSTEPRPQSLARTDSSHRTSSTVSKPREDTQEHSRAGRHQGTCRSRREASTLAGRMRAGCMAASRVEINMMAATRLSNRADRVSTRRRLREGILHRRLVGEVTNSREGIRHHHSTHRSIKGRAGRNRDGIYGEREVKHLMTGKVCYVMIWQRA